MKKLIKILGLILVAGSLIFLIITSIINSSSSTPEEVWEESIVIGREDAARHYIVYTDLSCGYCYRLSSILVVEEDLLKNYLSENDIKLELRVVPYLGSDLAFWGAEAISCAKDDGRSWDYFKEVINALGDDYFSGNDEVKIDTEYFVNIGKRIGMSEKFATCVKEHQKSDVVENLGDMAARKISGSGGVPYAKFGKYTSNGFDQSWGWNKLKQMMDAGL